MGLFSVQVALIMVNYLALIGDFINSGWDEIHLTSSIKMVYNLNDPGTSGPLHFFKQAQGYFIQTAIIPP
jgi:hypothetical protein